MNYDLGNLARGNGNYVEANEYYLSGLKYYSRQPDEFSQKRAALGNFNIGAVKHNLSNFTGAIESYKEVLKSPAARADKRLTNSTFLNISNNYKELLELDSALVYSQKASEYANTPESKAGLANNIGSILLLQEKYNAALKQFRIGDSIGRKIGEAPVFASASNNIGTIFLQQGKLDNAEKILLKMNSELALTDLVLSKERNNKGLEKLYVAKGDYRKAYNYLNQNTTLLDSINRKEQEKVVSELEIKYETEKLQNEKAAAEAQALVSAAESKQNQTFFIAASVTGGLILLSSLFFFSRMRERKKAEIVTLELKETQKRLALEKQYRSSELKAIKSQMNPHFIFNALNSIQEYIIVKEKKLAAEYLGMFADLIRAYLNYSNEGTVSLAEEIKTLEMYLDLEQLRFEEKLNCKVTVDENLDLEKIAIPTMLLQPYVENALNHGLLHKKNNRELTVAFNQSSDGNKLICVVEDNGIGRERAREVRQKRRAGHKSFATKATEDRLALLNFGELEKIDVMVEDKVDDAGSANGTKVTLTIPVK